MGAVVAIDALLHQRRLWRGQPTALPPSAQPSGHPQLDALLPTGGWPESALTELLITADGIGELGLLMPTLTRLSVAGEKLVLVAPPYLPFAPGWQAAGVRLSSLQVIEAGAKDAAWAAEQCLRSGSCGAVLCWQMKSDDRVLRRLQVAAESGQTLAFVYRSMAEAGNPSPAALRIAIDAAPAQLRVLKCRGGLAPPQPIPLAAG